MRNFPSDKRVRLIAFPAGKFHDTKLKVNGSDFEAIFAFQYDPLVYLIAGYERRPIISFTIRPAEAKKMGAILEERTAIFIEMLRDTCLCSQTGCR